MATRTHATQCARLHIALSTITLASLAACGGGSDAEFPGATTTLVQTVTLTGKVVINQAIKGATVCLDQNANGKCDSAEPVSSATGADGAYSLSYETAADGSTPVSSTQSTATTTTTTTTASVVAPMLLAQIPVSAVDAADATLPVTTSAYNLMAPLQKTGQINPLTTLVQTGVASGLSLADAEAAVALQMGVQVAEIYDYQATPAASATSVPDSARAMAQVVAMALQDGAPLSVVGLTAALDPTAQQVQFNFTDLSNYYVRTFSSTDVVGTGLTRTADTRVQKRAGTDVAANVLYQTAYLTKTGWVQCDATGFTNTRGNPSRSNYCGGGLPSVGYQMKTDIAGKTMGEVVRGMQAATDGSNTVNMDASLVDTQLFPAGSVLRVRTGFNIGQAVYINNLNAASEVNVDGGVSTVEAWIKARLAVPVNLQNGGGMKYIGNVGDNSHWLMVAFVDDVSQVQYYSCTFNAAATLPTGCEALNAGTFSIITVHGVRLVSFGNLPAVLPLNYTVGYGEYNNGIARYRMNKADLTAAANPSKRLNDVAGDALRRAVGL